MSEIRERLEEIRKLSKVGRSVGPGDDICAEIHEDATKALALLDVPGSPAGMRERIAKALFDAFGDGFEEAYGQRPEPEWSAAQPALREEWYRDADALLGESEPVAWMVQHHGEEGVQYVELWTREHRAERQVKSLRAGYPDDRFSITPLYPCLTGQEEDDG